MKSPTHILTTLILLATVALCAAALAGCAATRPPEPPSVGNNLGGARALGQFALQNVVTLKTHVDATHEPLRQSTANALTEQDVRLVAAEKANDAMAAQLNQTNKDLAATKQALTDERGQWISYQLRLWGKIIIGGAVATWLALGLLGTLTPLGGWGSTIMRLIPLANIFTWLRDRIHPAVVVPAPTPTSAFLSP
jgi:hypothetical protein